MNFRHRSLSPLGEGANSSAHETIIEPLYQTPLVSVVLPVRNGGAYFKGSLDSILNQTFKNFELIIVDDGSSDGSRELAMRESVRDLRIQVHANPGQGLVDALNHGVRSARAQIIARMDADDISHPDRLQRQWDYLQLHPDVAVVGTQINTIDHLGMRRGARSNFPCKPDLVSFALMARGCVVKHPTVMARKAALIDVGLYRSIMKDAEDYDLWLRVSEKYQISNMPDVLLDYREHDGQISRDDNVSQKLSHVLALISARRRRAGVDEPIINVRAKQISVDTDPEISTLLRVSALTHDVLRGNFCNCPRFLLQTLERYPAFTRHFRRKIKRMILCQLLWKFEFRKLLHIYFIK